MSQRDKKVSRGSIYSALAFCFFLSGLTALTYELAWLQKMQLVFGHTIYSQSVTLAAFLSGLGLGALLSNRIIKAGLHPLHFYLTAELAVGVFGFLFYPLIDSQQWSYVFSPISDQATLYALLQYFVSFLVILFPTTLMGTTLPLLVHFFASAETANNSFFDLYFLNTLGAAVGCYLCGFVFLPGLGYTKTVTLASVLNLVLFFLGCYILKISPLKVCRGATTTAKELDKRPPTSSSFTSDKFRRTAFLILFTSGFVSILAQILWHRLLSMIIGPSVYVFPMTLTIVLLGIIFGTLSSLYIKNPAQHLWMLSIASGLLFQISNYALSKLPLLIPSVIEMAGKSFPTLHLLEFGLLSVVLMPASVSIGMLFPIAMSTIANNYQTMGRGYALNILGLLAGSLLGVNLLLPVIGIEKLVLLASACLVLTGGAASLSYPLAQKRDQRKSAVLVALGLVIVTVFPSIDRDLLTRGLYENIPNGVATLDDFIDDAHSTISIHSVGPNQIKAFRIDGKTEGSVWPGELGFSRLTALLPLLVRPDAENVLTIGLGIGATAEVPLRAFPSLKSATVVEISPGVIDLARKHFSEINHLIWEDPRSKVLSRNAREYLSHTSEKFDLIIMQPSNPWMAGVASLYTAEHFQNVIARLKDDGWALIWFHLNFWDCGPVKTILKTLAESFDTIYAFSYNVSVFALVSPQQNRSLRMLPRSAEGAEKLLFDILNLKGPNRELNYRILADQWLVLSKKGIRAWTADRELNTDDNQRLQYEAGRSFWTDEFCDLRREFTNMTFEKPVFEN